MTIATPTRNLLLEQAVEAVIPVLGSYAGGTIDALADVEGAIDRASARFADRIAVRWHDWLKTRSTSETLKLFTDMAALSTEDARQEAAGVLDRHLLDVRPEDRSFALDYVAGIPGQVRQVLVFDRTTKDYRLPPDWSVLSPDALARFLPLAGELKAGWGKAGAKEPGTPYLQNKPDAPRTVLPILDAAPPPLPVVTSARSLRRPDVLPKLWLLLRCHVLADRSWWKRFFLTVLLVPPVAGLGVLAGTGVFFVIYENPHAHARMDHENYYIRNERVTRQEYDYFIAHSNEVGAAITAVLSGIGVAAGLLACWFVFLKRWPSPARAALQEQVQAILDAHAEEVRAWGGGAAVLRQRGLVQELLRLEERGDR